MEACDVIPKYFRTILIWMCLFIRSVNRLLTSPGAELPSNTCTTLSHVRYTRTFLDEDETQTCTPACALRHLRGLGCLCLVCLEFLASFHLHGAVDNPIGSQRLQPLHFHDHHLGSADTHSDLLQPSSDSSRTRRSKRKGENLEQTWCCQILPPF